MIPLLQCQTLARLVVDIGAPFLATRTEKLEPPPGAGTGHTLRQLYGFKAKFPTRRSFSCWTRYIAILSLSRGARNNTTKGPTDLAKPCASHYPLPASS